MNCSSNDSNGHHDAKCRVAMFSRHGDTITRADFNHTIGSRTINYRGWMPARYLSDGFVFGGLGQLIAMAGMKSGWADGTEVARHDVYLVDFALARISQSTIEAQFLSTECRED